MSKETMSFTPLETNNQNRQITLPKKAILASPLLEASACSVSKEEAAAAGVVLGIAVFLFALSKLRGRYHKGLVSTSETRPKDRRRTRNAFITSLVIAGITGLSLIGVLADGNEVPTFIGAGFALSAISSTIFGVKFFNNRSISQQIDSELGEIISDSSAKAKYHRGAMEDATARLHQAEQARKREGGS